VGSDRLSVGKTGIGGDGPVISLDRTGVERQRQAGGLNVGIPRGSRRRRQGKVVAPYPTATYTRSFCSTIFQ